MASVDPGRFSGRDAAALATGPLPGFVGVMDSMINNPQTPGLLSNAAAFGNALNRAFGQGQIDPPTGRNRGASESRQNRAAQLARQSGFNRTADTLEKGGLTSFTSPMAGTEQTGQFGSLGENVVPVESLTPGFNLFLNPGGRVRGFSAGGAPASSPAL